MSITAKIFELVIQTVGCPVCEVEPGDKCEEKNGDPRSSHVQRIDAYVDSVGGKDAMRERIAEALANVRRVTATEYREREADELRELVAQAMGKVKEVL